VGSLASGPVGVSTGRAKVDSVLASPGLEPGLREAIRAQGYAEAGECLVIGSALGTPAVLLAVGALALAVLRKGKPL
jgi:hypothetical protein